MLIIINQSLAIIGEGIRGSVDSLTINYYAFSQWMLAGDAVFHLIAYSIVNGNQSLRKKSIVIGGRCRIRTHVSGSEGRKDIQTTLIARNISDRQPLLEEVC